MLDALDHEKSSKRRQKKGMIVSRVDIFGHEGSSLLASSLMLFSKCFYFLGVFPSVFQVIKPSDLVSSWLRTPHVFRARFCH